jgi:hypothetical protein
MLDLPKSTYYNRIIPKDEIYSYSGASGNIKDLFVKQVERIRWLHKISPETVNIAAGEYVEEIQVIEVLLSTPQPDKRIAQTIRKAIPYQIVFVLADKDKTTYAVYYDSSTYFSTEIPPKLVGNDTDSVWENYIVQIGGVVVAEGNALDGQIAADKERAKTLRQIEQLEKQAQAEIQPRRKWELAEEVKRLREGLGQI